MDFKTKNTARCFFNILAIYFHILVSGIYARIINEAIVGGNYEPFI